eukprot:g792.t1
MEALSKYVEPSGRKHKAPSIGRVTGDTISKSSQPEWFAGLRANGKKPPRRAGLDPPEQKRLGKQQTKILYGRLLDLTKDIAEEIDKPYYTIFSNTTLRTIARVAPLTIEDFQKLDRVGIRTVTKFGERYMTVILDYLASIGKYEKPRQGQIQVELLCHVDGEEVKRKKSAVVPVSTKSQMAPKWKPGRGKRTVFNFTDWEKVKDAKISARVYDHAAPIEEDTKANRDVVAAALFTSSKKKKEKLKKTVLLGEAPLGTLAERFGKPTRVNIGWDTPIPPKAEERILSLSNYTTQIDRKEPGGELKLKVTVSGFEKKFNMTDAGIAALAAKAAAKKLKKDLERKREEEKRKENLKIYAPDAFLKLYPQFKPHIRAVEDGKSLARVCKWATNPRAQGGKYYVEEARLISKFMATMSKSPPCQVKIEVTSASNLPRADRNSSDPYVRLKCKTTGQEFRTSTKRKNLNPEWFEELTFSYATWDAARRADIYVEVWDWDLIGKDDLIGVCRLGRLPIEGTGEDRELELTNKTKGKDKDKSGGIIELRIRSLANGEQAEEINEHSLMALISAKAAARKMKASLRAKKKAKEVADEVAAKMVAAEAAGSVTVEVVSAEGLPRADVQLFGKGSSDPFVELSVVNGIQKFRTSTKKKNLNPTWNEILGPFQFASWEECINADIDIKMFDYDLIGSNDLMGVAKLGPLDVRHGLPLRGTTDQDEKIAIEPIAEERVYHLENKTTGKDKDEPGGTLILRLTVQGFKKIEKEEVKQKFIQDEVSKAVEEANREQQDILLRRLRCAKIAMTRIKANVEESKEERQRREKMEELWADNKGKGAGIVEVDILSCSDLPRADRTSSDPYVELLLDVPSEEKEQPEIRRTKTVKKNLNPTYNESFAFYFKNWEECVRSNIEIKVWDWDFLSSNDLMCSALLGSFGFRHGEPIDRASLLEPIAPDAELRLISLQNHTKGKDKHAPGGTIKIKVNVRGFEYTEEVVREHQQVEGTNFAAFQRAMGVNAESKTDDSSEPIIQQSPVRAVTPTKDAGRVLITVLYARDLPKAKKSTDPYVKFTVVDRDEYRSAVGPNGDGNPEQRSRPSSRKTFGSMMGMGKRLQTGRTSTQKNTMNPIWPNEEIIFNFNSWEECATFCLKTEVFHSDRFRDSLLGACVTDIPNEIDVPEEFELKLYNYSKASAKNEPMKGLLQVNIRTDGFLATKLSRIEAALEAEAEAERRAKEELDAKNRAAMAGTVAVEFVSAKNLPRTDAPEPRPPRKIATFTIDPEIEAEKEEEEVQGIDEYDGYRYSELQFAESFLSEKPHPDLHGIVTTFSSCHPLESPAIDVSAQPSVDMVPILPKRAEERSLIRENYFAKKKEFEEEAARWSSLTELQKDIEEDKLEEELKIAAEKKAR